MRLSLVDDSAAIEPVELDEAKLQLRLPVGQVHPEDDLILDIMIPAARQRAEGATNRSLRQVTWALALDRGETCGGGGWIEIPKAPLVEVLGVTYTDTDGVTQTFAADQYLVDAPAGPKPRRGRLALAYGATWPATRDQVNALTISFVAGYAAQPAQPGWALPPLLKLAMLLDIATLYELRSNISSGVSVNELPGNLTSSSIYRSFKSHSTTRLAA